MKKGASLYERVRQILESAKSTVARSVNSTQVVANWLIGEEIVEDEQNGKWRAGYGKQVLLELSQRLQTEYGNGYSVDNLELFRRFYREYPALIPDAVRRISRNTGKDEKALQKSSVIPSASVVEIGYAVRHPSVIEFTGLPESPKLVESDLETALINNLQSFLLELGKGFAFVARQERLTLDGDHFYIDLVFYHTILKCYVIIDLKTGKLTHQDLGQLQLYVNYYDRE